MIKKECPRCGRQYSGSVYRPDCGSPTVYTLEEFNENREVTH